MKSLEKKLKKNDTQERCGLILKDGSVIELDNIAVDKENGYQISPADIVKYEDTMVGSWHTHPGHDSNLSEKDYVGFLMWPDLTHYIVGIDGVAKYTIKDGIILNVD